MKIFWTYYKKSCNVFCYFKENAQLVQKVTAETLMGFKKKQQQQQQKLKVGNIVKAPKLLKRTITFFN